MIDLFGWTPPPKYPDAPGFKEKGGTSQGAAEVVGKRLSELHIKVLAAYDTNPLGLTADEAAAVIGEDKLTVRPRVTELGKLKKLRKTKERRKNDSGVSAAVWRLS